MRVRIPSAVQKLSITMKMNFNIFGYKVDVVFNEYFPYRYWFFYFKRYISVKGFIIRIFGVYVNVREKNTSAILIKKMRESKKVSAPRYLVYIPECEIIFSSLIEKGVEEIRRKSAAMIEMYNEHWRKMKKAPIKSPADEVNERLNEDFKYANTLDINSIVVKYKL